jgi:hypothetical protein
MDLTILPEYRNHPETVADMLVATDIAQLVKLLNEKNDDIRYPALLILQKRSEKHPDIYPYWPVFTAKMDDANSFQRNIGIMMIAANIKWDEAQQFTAAFPHYIGHCTDEKFITCRVTLQSIPQWVAYRPDLLQETAAKLMAIDVSKFKESQTKLILIDIMNALLAICAIISDEAIDQYIGDALGGGVLDKKSVKSFETKMYYVKNYRE